MTKQNAFFRNMDINGTKKRKKRQAPKAPDAFLLELDGSTSISVLDSTANRLVSKYTNCGWKGPKQCAYASWAAGWQGHLWDIVILRACHNFLQATGLSHFEASNLIKDQILLASCEQHGQGRPAGVRGERRGDGRKTHGTKREFILGGNSRQWLQIGITNSTASVLDMCNLLRIRFSESRKRRSTDWSRQKNLTFLSMANKVPGYRIPLMSEFFFQDSAF